MDPIEFRLIDSFRERVRALAFAPVSVSEATEAGRAYRAGEENNRLEGLHTTPGDRAFAAMLIEERVPVALWTRLGADYARALIVARSGEASASRSGEASVPPIGDAPG